MPRLAARMILTVLVALPFALSVASAEPRDEGERHEHVDARHQHNHRYLDRGVVIEKVPRDAYRVRVAGTRYWYDGGVWYGADGPRYVVVAPPIGAIVDVLPTYYTTVRFGGVQYYYANDAYYVFSRPGRGFEIVAPPPGIEGATSAPAAANLGSLFVYPRNGQSPEQQSTDRAECDRWAVEQSGFDPAREGGGGPAAGPQKRADYGRAYGACLDGRGYTVR